MHFIFFSLWRSKSRSRMWLAGRIGAVQASMVQGSYLWWTWVILLVSFSLFRNFHDTGSFIFFVNELVTGCKIKLDVKTSHWLIKCQPIAQLWLVSHDSYFMYNNHRVIVYNDYDVNSVCTKLSRNQVRTEESF